MVRKMNWKIVLGLVIVAGLIGVGMLGMHTQIHTNTTTVGSSGGNPAPSGPHPADNYAWSIVYSTSEGPHPADNYAW
ncbi:hypothetical protein AciM339_0599 [Aciduliprofundum sp. MAR08-339]|uniref:hypothetical protein n=1 Tax=Aciduliprofundum sp. (strain MAR08-339) TaxID=673860 RepID=UPI0002A48C42|nr:hypothetical protein AciM339_0599 [Aciduliprofundum sp. MAR08-339]